MFGALDRCTISQFPVADVSEEEAADKVLTELYIESQDPGASESILGGYKGPFERRLPVTTILGCLDSR